MYQIPLLAWVGIAIIVIITLVINISLIAMLRAKTPPHLSARQPRAGFIGTAQNLAKLGRVMRDPFAGERGQMNELSRLVQGLDKPKGSEPNNQDDPQNTHLQAK